LVYMNENADVLLERLRQGDKKALARCITVVENGLEGCEVLLNSLQQKNSVPVIGITGPPGAGKSTLLNSMIRILTLRNKKIGIVAIDPTSPFNYGSLLGDRLRMAEHFTNENVFIRSLATRGSLGGLSAKIIEVVDVMKCFDFDYLFVETVGVGQSEVEIVGLADLTVLVLVPESGDEVQTLKSGVMEIADIFVVNKSDRDGAGIFIKNLMMLVHSRLGKDSGRETPVIRAVATNDEGTEELILSIDNLHGRKINDKRSYLLAEKAFHLIQNRRMSDIRKIDLRNQIEKELSKPGFNLYTFVRSYYTNIPF
jgi:LAO/AO transport system kinase